MPAFKSWMSFHEFAFQSKTRRRYIHETDSTAFIRSIRTTARKRLITLEAGSTLCRAQIGNDYELTCQDGIEIDIPRPFSPERMKPKQGQAREGRANPKGIPVLYLCDEIKTAIAEVRPWIGSYVSVAVIEIRNQLTVVDCMSATGSRKLYFGEPTPAKRERAVWSDLDRAFSEPITPVDDVADYATTQILAEAFAAEGFDGLSFRSSVNRSGRNFVLFDLQVASVVDVLLFSVTDIQCQYKPEGGYSRRCGPSMTPKAAL